MGYFAEWTFSEIRKVFPFLVFLSLLFIVLDLNKYISMDLNQVYNLNQIG